MQRPYAELTPRLEAEIRRLEYLFSLDTGRQIALVAYEGFSDEPETAEKV